MTRCYAMALLCGVLGVGCGGKSAPTTGTAVSTTSNADEASPEPAPAPAPEPEPETTASAVSAGMDMLEAVGAAIAADADCAARAASLRAWHAANTAMIADVSARLKAQPVDQVNAEVEAQMPQRSGATALFEAAYECRDDAAFAGAWAEISAAFEQ